MKDQYAKILIQHLIAKSTILGTHVDPSGHTMTSYLEEGERPEVFDGGLMHVDIEGERLEEVVGFVDRLDVVVARSDDVAVAELRDLEDLFRPTWQGDGSTLAVFSDNREELSGCFDSQVVGGDVWDHGLFDLASWSNPVDLGGQVKSLKRTALLAEANGNVLLPIAHEVDKVALAWTRSHFPVKVRVALNVRRTTIDVVDDEQLARHLAVLHHLTFILGGGSEAHAGLQRHLVDDLLTKIHRQFGPWELKANLLLSLFSFSLLLKLALFSSCSNDSLMTA